MEEKKHRIICISDFGTTGIAESVMAPLHHWHNSGHEIWQLVCGYSGWPNQIDEKEYPWKNRILPIWGTADPNERFGQRVIKEALKASNADVVFTAYDIWMIAYLGLPEKQYNLDADTLRAINHDTRQFKHIAYFPIDGLVQGKYLGAGLGEVIAGFDLPATYSRYSQQAIYREMHINVPFIPISHDPAVYCPGDKAESRKILGFPEDKFIVGMVASNQFRKLWGTFIEGCAKFSKGKDDVMILPYTKWDQKLAGGAEINDLAYRTDEGPKFLDMDKTAGRLTNESMAHLYRSLDVLVLTTIGEGCGLPPLRARACGTPVIVSDNTSNTEFSTHEFELLRNSVPFYDPMGSNLERYLSDADELADKLERLYKYKSLREEMSVAGILGMKQYENQNIMPLWDEMLEAE